MAHRLRTLCRSSRRPLALGLAAGAIALAGAGAPARAATATEVKTVIDKAKEYLYKTQQAGTNWEVVPRPDPKDNEQFHVTHWQWGGVTGCAIYGLLASGENPQDKKLAPAIAWLEEQPLNGHYAVAMRCQMYPFLPDPTGREKPVKGAMTRKKAADRDALILEKAMYENGPYTGFYSYYTDNAGRPQEKWHDLSVSQISVLGVWACEQAGAEIPDKYWRIVDAAWKKAQHPSGGWTYQLESKDERGSMTAAGVATLHITQDYLMQGVNWSTCHGGQRNENIERGMGWVDKNINGMLQSAGEYGLYQMYGVERIGVASGRKYFGTVDWGAQGAEWLVHHQNPDGSFGSDDEFHNPRKVPDTTFALLFLCRGRAPVIMNKLEYQVAAAPGAPAGKPAAPARAAGGPGGGQADPWNERPRDAANFAHWSGKQLETYYLWQIVNLKVSADDLHDAPILYISGSESLNFSDEECDKLREFVEDGGLILGNADCANGNFTKGFVSLGHKLFNKYEFRDLPTGHLIFTGENFKAATWKNHPRLHGLSNEVRELMILAPDADLSKAWQVRSEKTRLDLYQLGFDIFQYTGGTLQTGTRGEPYIIKPDPKANATRPVKLARLTIGGNDDPEPGGWRRLTHLLHNTANVNLTVESIHLGDGKLKDYRIADLTGTAKFNLSPDQQKELKDFVAGGGTLIVDAAGGATPFAASAETALAATFGTPPGNFGVILPPDSEVYTLPGAKIEKFEYRRFVKGKINGRLNAPRVRGLQAGGRVQVFYSAEDLAAGMVGQETDGILGYTPATATDLMRNMVLYAAFGTKAVAAK